MKLLTVKQVSTLTGLSRSLIYRELRTGRLRHYILGKKAIRIDQADLEAYCQAGLVESGEREPLTTAPPLARSRQATQFRHLKVSQALAQQNPPRCR